MKTQKRRFRIHGTKIRNSIKKCALLFSLSLFQFGIVFGQVDERQPEMNGTNQTQTYDNFEGSKLVHYISKTGTLDSSAKNPSPNNINSSPKCAKYVRNGKQKYDNIKMTLSGKLSNVGPYATYSGVPPKIKMKVYTTAPAGTLVEIQLGRRDNGIYPAGIHSQYQAYTTVTKAWEEIEFKFSQIPNGSEASTTEIDQITLLFNPNSSTSDTYYFDDIVGPPLISEVESQSR